MGERLARVCCLATFLVVVALLTGCESRQAVVERHMSRGLERLEAGDLARARVEFRNAIQLEPEAIEAYVRLGEIAERGENWRNAAKAYQRALLVDPQSPRANTALGQLMLRFGDVKGAGEAAQQALRGNADDATALALSGWVALREGAPDRAAALAGRALGVDPDDQLAVTLRAELLARDGDVDGAVALLREAGARNPQDDFFPRMLAQYLARYERLGEAIDTLEAAIALRPDRVENRMALASLLLADGRVAQARSVLIEVYAQQPSPVVAERLTGVIVGALPAGEAAASLEALVRRFPEEPALRLGLVSLHQREEDWPAARAVIEAIVAAFGESSPAGLDARTSLARQQLIAGQDDAAWATLDGVLADSPRAVDALVLRANLALRRGEPERAAMDLRLALDAGEQVAVLKRLLAEAYLAAGDVALAVEALQEAIQAAPEDAGLRLSLARLASRTNQLDLAREQVDLLVRQGVTSPELLQLQFFLAEHAGDLGIAADVAARYAERYPQDGTAPYLRGRVAHLRGDWAAAREAYASALALSPDDADILSSMVRADVAAGDADAAVARLRTWLDRAPDDPKANLLLGDVLLHGARDPESARAAFIGLTESQPGWWLPWRRLAELARDRGDSPRARALLEEGLAATGWHPLLADDLAALQLRAGDEAAAIATYEALVEAHPKLPSAANNLAMLLAAHRGDDADSLARAAALIAPYETATNPAFLDTAGFVRLQRGELQQAVALLEEAVRGAPQRPTPRYHLALAYLRTGDRLAAARELDAALAASAPFPERQAAERARERLTREPAASSDGQG